MQKRLKKVVTMVMCVAMIFGFLSNTVVATEISQNQFNVFIKEAKLLKNDNTVFSSNEEFKFGDTFKIRYYFNDLSVSGTEGTTKIEVDQKYSLGTVPEFLMTNELVDITWDIYLDGTSVLLGKASCTSDGDISIVFSNSDDIKDAEKITAAYLEFSVQLDKALCGDQEKVVINLDAGMPNYNIVITDNKPLPPVLKKTVVYDSQTKTFLWTIAIQKGKIAYANGLELIDVFSANQDYVTNSFSVSKDAVSIPGQIPIVNGKQLSYRTIEGTSEYKITYKTKLNDKAYVIDNKVSNNQKVEVSNQAKLFDINTDKEVTGDTKTIEQETGMNWIAKTADEKVIQDNKALVTWHIEVDTNGYAFSDIILYDTITDGVPSNRTSKLSLVTNSIEVKNQGNTQTVPWEKITADNNAGAIDNNNFKWSMNLNDVLGTATLNDKYSISYQTEITNYSDYVKYNQPQIKNDARMIFTCPTFDGIGQPSNVYGTPTIKKESTITAGNIKKEYVSYEKSTHQMKWKVTFNGNKNVISEQVKIKDSIEISNEHEIIGINNLVVDGTPINNPDDYYNISNISGKEYTIEFKNSTLISQKVVTFDVITKLTNPNYYENNNKDEAFKNAATVYLGNVEYSTVTATAKPEISVLSKKGISYDYKEQVINWEIITNQDKMELKGAKIEDSLIAGLSLVEPSPVLKDSQGNTIVLTDIASTTDPYYTYQNNKLSVYLHTINDTYTLTYQTKVDVTNGAFDTKSFGSYNGDITIVNSAKLLKDTSDSASVETTFEVDNKVLEKHGNPVKEEQMIKYHIGINQAMTPMEKTLLEDILSPGLLLSLPSIKLYEATVDSDGNLSKKASIDGTYTTTILSQGNDKNKEEDSTLLQIQIPKNDGKAYILEYNAYITDFTRSDFTNEIEGAGIIPGNTQTRASFSANNVGVGGAGDLVKSSIAEFTLEDKETHVGIVGVEYTLYYQDKEIGKQVTDSNGKISFKGLEEGVPYHLVQASEALGYIFDKENDISFTGPKKGSSNKLETTIEATRIPLVIKNIDDENKVMVNTSFNIYKVFDDPTKDISKENIKDYIMDDYFIAEMITNSVGEVTYKESLGDGIYAITQTKVEEGYSLSDEYIIVLVQNGLIINMYNSKDTNKLFFNTIINVKKEVETPDVPNIPDDPTHKPIAPGGVNSGDTTNINFTIYIMISAVLVMIKFRRKEE